MDILFEPGRINTMTLSNRFVRSGTWDGLATDDGECTPRMIRIMTQLAQGGVGLIITGHAYVHKHGQHSPWQLGIHKDKLIPTLRAMTDAVHEKGGKMVVQLGYGGAYLSKSRVRQMSVQDIRDVVDSFGQAALRAQKAGFDGVQIFAAHGFFLSQLLCPRYNDREDGYGGAIQNRARALIEVLRSVREKVGRGYPVLVKLNGQDFVEGGLCLEDSLTVGIMLEQGGIDAIELSGGLLNSPNLMKNSIRSEEEEAGFRQEACAFKKQVHVPLILVGGIRSYPVARKLVEEGTADFVSMSRPFICEPDLVSRWQSGDLRTAQCISCNNCVEEVKKGEGLICVPLEEASAVSFFPQISGTVQAGPPLPPGAYYEVSIGLEEWESSFIPVLKVQLFHHGRVLQTGLSFPLGTKDRDNVNKAIVDLLEKHAAMSSKTS
jgi:2,4-dienoyl-CoA reductase-like NADH-dependent reductase (Old Yellow Enzyme family)